MTSIVGQKEIQARLARQLHENAVPHALLFCGPEGSGKLAVALRFAQALLCKNPNEGQPCGQCQGCKMAGDFVHPDLHFVFPIVKSDDGDVCDAYAEKWRGLVTEHKYFDLDDWYRVMGAETKQGIIYEKESSEIMRKLSLKSFAGGYKIMVIWQPEKMNSTCANKLLKLLEEPPEKTLFLLVSEQKELLLSTILSRVQEVKVPRLSEETIAAGLRDEYTWLSQEDAQTIAHMANGSYLEAIRQLADETSREEYFNDFVALMRNAWLVGQKKDYSALLKLRQWSMDMADSKVGREKQKAFLQYAQRQIRENYIYNLGNSEMNYQTKQERAFSTKFAPFIHDGNVERMMNELSKAETQIAQNGNAKIIFFDLCLQMIVMVK